MKCQICGADVDLFDDVCANCGASLDEEIHRPYQEQTAEYETQSYQEPTIVYQAQPYQEPIIPKIVATGEPHLACVLLIDTSVQEGGNTIENINKGMQRLIAKVSMEERASKRADVAVITYGGGVRIKQEFTPVALITEPVTLQAGGTAAMGEGIEITADLIAERLYVYDTLGAPAYRPWVFMISNNAPEDDISYAARLIRDGESDSTLGSMRFFALGAGNYDKDAMFKITNRVMELTDNDFDGIFSWLAESILAITASDYGDDVKLGNLPANARVVKLTAGESDALNSQQ